MAESTSVVMATYNGAAYVERQLASILGQLGADDEVIIVDDHSRDATVALIAGFNDARVRMHRNPANLGVQRSFEKAIGLATGDIIFLSDQDDVWHPEKVARFARAFAERPEVTLVLSDARIVDRHGLQLQPSFFAIRGGFAPGLVSNLVKNKYLGCVMAFRRVLLDKMLPFPPDIPQHDMWIGLINALYGRAHYIDLALVDYRRHDANASPTSSNTRGSLVQMLGWRWALVTGLAARAYARRGRTGR
ncbi:MAG: glycosyltransferase family 2 protein [Pseudomonadota bacterium]